jgi:hypothetical protein
VFSGSADELTGLRRLPWAGPMQSRLSWTLSLPRGTYYWSVQAVDTSFAGSAWAPEQSFSLDSIKVCGTVTASGVGLGGVRVTADGRESYLTDSTGYYEIWVPNGWSGTVTPWKLGSEMIPLHKDYTNLATDQLDQNYATTPTWSDSGFTLAGTNFTSIAWGDYDNDGWLDVLMSGASAGSGSAPAKLYHNANGVLTDSGISFPQMANCTASWGDYDRDGDLDLALSGREYDSVKKVYTDVTHVYRNDSGVITDIATNLPGLTSSHVAWTDFDNDGDLDLTLAGGPAAGEVIKI